MLKRIYIFNFGDPDIRFFFKHIELKCLIIDLYKTYISAVTRHFIVSEISKYSSQQQNLISFNITNSMSYNHKQS